MKYIRNKKRQIRKTYENEFLRFITQGGDKLSIEPGSYLEKKVLQALIIDYNSFISGSNQTLLLEKIGKESMINKVERYLKSTNRWKNKTGTYLAGEYDLKKLEPLLLKQLYTSDNELFFITARSLIKINNKTYLKEILRKSAEQSWMSKNNTLSLLELIEGDIEEILLEIMETEDMFLQVIALEESGKRHYQKSVGWIEKMSQSPEKELRIAALKASDRLGNTGESSYLARLMSLKNDPEWEVRAFLAKFLKKVNSDQAVNILMEFMRDENWYVRHNAAESLFYLDEKGHAALKALLHAEDPFASDAARAVLQREALYKETTG
ncbi:HEAT repeat domain-containing protein [Alkalibacterium subtropicum]|nr:HEAT repeat domain-containing protein [Alkalibacterium subtropicum]